MSIAQTADFRCHQRWKSRRFRGKQQAKQLVHVVLSIVPEICC